MTRPLPPDVAELAPVSGAAVLPDGDIALLVDCDALTTDSPAAALARIPDGLSAVEAAPLMCAGVTTFNALRHSGARPGHARTTVQASAVGRSDVRSTQTRRPLSAFTVSIRPRAAA